MSAHPNVLLILRLTPDGLARKTYKAILKDSDVKDVDMDDIEIGEEKYHHMVMEGDYDEGYQISAKEGDIVIFDLVTYGYGEDISFEKLSGQKQELSVWAESICKKHNCAFEISVSANYW